MWEDSSSTYKTVVTFMFLNAAKTGLYIFSIFYREDFEELRRAFNRWGEGDYIAKNVHRYYIKEIPIMLTLYFT